MGRGHNCQDKGSICFTMIDPDSEVTCMVVFVRPGWAQLRKSLERNIGTRKEVSVYVSTRGQKEYSYENFVHKCGGTAYSSRSAIAAALGGIPGEGAPPDAVYAFDWSQVDAAVDRVAAVSDATADADARAVELAKVLAEANALRDVAIGEATSAPKPATAASADDAGVSARANELLPN